MINSVAVIGASGGIGEAIVHFYSDFASEVYAFSRTSLAFESAHVHTHLIDYTSEDSIKQAASLTTWDLVVVTTGLLSREPDIKPEKAFSQIDPEAMQEVYYVNCVLPSLIGKYFLPGLNKNSRSVFAALSARVGSISDNQLGGWHSYRASKAALNMVIKNFAIEMQRKNKQAIVVGLHPGTVDTGLSKPFQSRVPEGKLFTPEYSAQRLGAVINGLNPEDSGGCFAWDGELVLP